MTARAAIANTAVRRAHRPDIDGLRACAVIPVILFHAGFAQVSGGYVGVDVFFVISGFLITGIVAGERAAGRFSLARFYERRARRILPALFVVAAACVPFAWWWMVPSELAAFGKSLAAVALFVSNVLFWRTSGYFDLAAAERPLLHTWSLGIEEQFYVFLPLLLVLVGRFMPRRAATVIVLIAVASLIASEVLLRRDAVASFYLLPTRAWELLAGAWLAMLDLRRDRPRAIKGVSAELFMMAALSLILVPVFAYGATTPFPGIHALVPVVGTLMILGVPLPATVAGRFLTIRPMLGVGAISYSAYLWHQPLFAFARLATTTPPPLTIFALLSFAALGLGALSWRFVEQPFRTQNTVSPRAILLGAITGSMVLIAVGIALVVTKGAPQRFTPAERTFVQPPKTAIDGCPSADPWINICHLGAPGIAPSVALVGDSHAYALATDLGVVLRREGRAAVLIHSDCHPIAGVYDSRIRATSAWVAHCAEADRRLIAAATAPSIRGIIVAIRWNMRLFPLGQAIDAPTFDNGEGGVEAAAFRNNLTIDAAGRLDAAAEPKIAATRRYISALAAHKPTVIVYPVPEAGWSPTRLNAVAVGRGEQPAASITTSWARERQRNAAVEAVLDSVTGPYIRRSHPAPIFCDSFVRGRCAVQADGQLFYYDDNHLASAGARLVIADTLRVLR